MLHWISLISLLPCVSHQPMVTMEQIIEFAAISRNWNLRPIHSTIRSLGPKWQIVESSLDRNALTEINLKTGKGLCEGWAISIPVSNAIECCFLANRNERNANCVDTIRVSVRIMIGVVVNEGPGSNPESPFWMCDDSNWRYDSRTIARDLNLWKLNVGFYMRFECSGILICGARLILAPFAQYHEFATTDVKPKRPSAVGELGALTNEERTN
jgi:hypothetical protein